ncbi:hypothetical protein [Microbacterium sp. cf332]|uniref:hypothetical protein n=1 Tax=Microbacterium sp. cf332 TaxID=1761804 RepID=UPI00088B4FC8|nr:hypothetical protein [Microbacterium sp. cf332]SDQ61554.1 hypothetical protein SAMN04487847_2087 [Microbacterium sp. cf332]
MNTRQRLAAAVAATVVATAAGMSAAPAAWAAASVSVATGDGDGRVSADTATAVTVSGSGFQAIPGGFGGIYVLIGWVDDPAGGSWAPSVGGVVGEDYRYIPDVEAADNNGFQRFIAFAGSQTESSANGVLAADGSWSIDMVVPGAVFESRDRDGNVTAVDCRELTCGIITIGAHGVKNANNETFTPLDFSAAAEAPAAESADAAPAGGAVAGAVRVGLASQTVDAGTSIVFTGQGFTPGEQVVASLDGGLAAVGPLTAGSQGEVAAALPVPRDIRDGTHLVTLRGAGSGAVAEAEVTVSGGTVADAAAATSSGQTPPWAWVVLLVSLTASVLLIIASLITAIVRARARRRARRATETASAPPASDGGVETRPRAVTAPAGAVR